MSSLQLEELTNEIKMCQRCELRYSATSPVPGHGDIGSRYFLIGEAPGRDEDIQGIPFVGSSGRRLNKLLELAGIDPNECYFTNVCRCRPPDNRTPRKGEVRACQRFLWRELKLVKPRTIITLGSTPLGLFCPYGVTQMHGTSFEWELEDSEAGLQERVLVSSLQQRRQRLS